MAKKKILLIDDNLEVLESLKGLLEREKYEVITATNGNEAVISLQNSDILPDMIISDIFMEETDGYELFKIVIKDPFLNQIPFIFITSNANPEIIRFSKSLGVDDILVKPIIAEDLLAVIEGKMKRVALNQISNIPKPDPYIRKSDVFPEKMNEYDNFVLFSAEWSSISGPKITGHYCPWELNYSLNQIISQIFQGFKNIYKKRETQEPVDLLINLNNINQQCILISIPLQPDEMMHDSRMVGIIAPNISYIQRLELKKFLSTFSDNIKKSVDIADFEKYWKKAKKILINQYNIDFEAPPSV